MARLRKEKGGKTTAKSKDKSLPSDRNTNKNKSAGNAHRISDAKNFDLDIEETGSVEEDVRYIPATLLSIRVLHGC